MAEASRSGATGFKMQVDSWPSETIAGTSLTAEYSHSTGKHSLDLQVSGPSGRTAEAIKPDVVALANATIAKLP
jgi:hypothetical protein